VGATPEPKRGGHLIVARSTGVHATPGIAEHGHELPLDQRVHVLVCRTLVDRHPCERVLDLRRLVGGDDALAPEHPHVRLRRCHVIREQALIDVQRLRQCEHVRVQPTLEPTAPERSACLGTRHATPSRRA
jgi:hypothetical protein